ncbi:hypothetical protein N0V90_005699 [Kalmusia sp. IMI 367209]|nr:hypothetical protein N0V90_005699 [Kalmusia sp. IMI 367209]
MTPQDDILCVPELGFCVFHHFALPLSPAPRSPIQIHTISLGVFTSFFSAQAAALDALNVNVMQLSSMGIAGNFCKDIDLVHRGLITHYDSFGQELPLSEYEIRPVRLCHTSGPPMGGAYDALFDAANQKAIIVSLPPEPINPAELLRRCNVYEQEKEPHWTQSRIPYFRKRDEGPFRRVGDAPYASTFSLYPPKARARDGAVPQPDVLRDVPQNNRQVNRSGVVILQRPQAHGRAAMQIQFLQPDELKDAAGSPQQAKDKKPPQTGAKKRQRSKRQSRKTRHAQTAKAQAIGNGGLTC